MPENILHFGAVRLRINGSGKLNMKLITTDDAESTTLLPLTIEESTSRQPTRLCNFLTQRAKLELSTDGYDDFMNVNRIIIYIKPTYTSYPM